MSGPTIFQVTDGAFALAVVDTTAPGYSDAWQTPGGKDVKVVTMADYTTGHAGADAWQCQVTSGALTASSNTNTVTVPATWCSPSQDVVQPGVTSYSLDLTILQDPNIGNGITAFLFEHDTDEAYFLLGLDKDPGPPKAVGRVKLVAGSFGGEARANLTADVSFPVSRKPDIWFGSSTTDPNARVVYGSGAPAPVKGSAKPGDVFPAEATITASDAPNAAKLAGLGYVASPTTAWTAGQKITVGTFDFNWSGTAWAAGAHA